MTTDQPTGPLGPPPGYYRATDGRDYPVPPGYVLGADGLLHAVAGPPAAAAPAGSWTWNAASVLTVAGAAVVILGAFLPWATIGAFSVSGTDGDGVLTLILAIAAGLLGAAGIHKASAGMLIGSFLCAGLALVIGIYDLANISSIADGPFGFDPEVGSGLYLTVVGASAGVVGSALALRGRQQRRSQAI